MHIINEVTNYMVYPQTITVNYWNLRIVLLNFKFILSHGFQVILKIIVPIQIDVADKNFNGIKNIKLKK